MEYKERQFLIYQRDVIITEDLWRKKKIMNERVALNL